MSHTREYVGVKSLESTNYDGKGNDLCNMWVTDQPVTRCRDCKTFKRNATPHDPEYPHFCVKHGIDLKDGDGFCSWGERA